ncbi:MAG TPA: carboxypeptidase-like regulatory domain-containing protein [Thermoanaerobaculia bacterium]|nr:carboxypeptidase-like regulatory domain-containing protein [Thermoanaerobaculia bacterium]
MAAHRFVFALLLMTIVLAPNQAAAKESLRLVDDRGKVITGEVEVCFQIDTRSDCVSGRETLQSPADFLSLRIEGPNYGPVFLRREELKTDPNGDLRIAVPRKATLQIANSPERLSVSLYPQDDPTFRAPSFRRELRGDSSLKVPAGDHLVSLAAAGQAPDLQFLNAKPGSNERLVYHSRPGWSFVVRCRSEKEGTPVPGAQIELCPMAGYSINSQKERQTAGKSGLALFSGVPHLLASAVVDHPRFVPHREEGISASPGTFAFREALLEEGGRLRAKVVAEGKPLPGVDCRVLEYDANPRGPAPEPQVHFQATTDKAGICRSGRIAAGPYTLRLARSGSRSFLDRSVVLSNGDETEVEVAMASIRVHGTVHRGSQPAPSYVVTFSDENEIKPNATRHDAQAEATTNEEGDYDTLLWSAGDYDFMVRTPEGTPAGHKQVRLESADEQADFSLEEHDVAGVVLDEHDLPVANATVQLSWNQRSHRLAWTGEKGTFSFPLTEDGEGTVRVAKAGYVEPPLVKVEASPGAYPLPLVLRLKRTGFLSGKLLGPMGPAAGATLISYRLEPGGTATALGMAVANGEGRFELAASGGAPTRVFATGAGCPLTSFDLVPAAEETVIHCAELPASLELRFLDPRGKPVSGKDVFVRKDGVVIPNDVLAMHLGGLHLPTATDGGGRLFLAGLAPGTYDVYLAEATNPEVIASGLPNGFLTAASLAPFTTTELELTLEGGR